MANKNPSPATRFKKGVSGNPSGQQADAQKLRYAFVRDIQREWERRGEQALKELSARDLVTAAQTLIGKDVNLNHSGAVAHEHRAVSEAARLVGEILGLEARGDGADVSGAMH
jgi:hypothetical protein